MTEELVKRYVPHLRYDKNELTNVYYEQHDLDFITLQPP